MAAREKSKSEGFALKAVRLLGLLAVLAVGYHFGLFKPTDGDEPPFPEVPAAGAATDVPAASAVPVKSAPAKSTVAEPRETVRATLPAPKYIDHAMVEDSGKVYRLLPDDNEGLRHQKFLVRTASRDSVMIVLNIDIAPRIEGIAIGDIVEFRGEFIDNERGGLVHWTHHDPSGRHAAGWIRHKGRKYE